jgi:hypothetical protein
MRQTRDDDILRDGQTFRVPMTAMDAANRRALVERSQGLPRALDSVLRFADGSTDLVGHRPGFIVSDDAERIRRDAWEQSRREMCDAWRTPPNAGAPPPRIADAAHDPTKPISMQDSWRIRSAAYEQSVADLCNAWKGGKP